ncbi:MAG TPA: ABC transporter permease [Gaiellaceae bacterium]|nr:ABC transporter permease [Gaiellaceae bacterium]
MTTVSPDRALPPSQMLGNEAADLILIEPRARVSLGLGELWRHRELAWFLVLRAVKPRYRQTVLGVGWAVVPPVAMMVVFSVFLNRFAGVPSESGIPYPIFSFSGLLAWQYFAVGATRGAGSLLGNAAFLTKIYFPRPLIPLSAVLAALFDLAIAFLVLVPLMAYYGYTPGWAALTLPAFVALATAAALAVSLWIAAAGVQYRDLGLAVPLLIQVWLFATPVAYPLSVFPDGWQTALLVANPMATVVEGFRWALLGTGAVPGWPSAASAALTLVAVLGGLLFFNRMERTYADEI